VLEREREIVGVVVPPTVQFDRQLTHERQG
jgi:hypothetical protein